MTAYPRYEVYRDSDLEWLGEIPTHWNLLRNKYLFKERVEKGFPDEPLLAATQAQGVVRKTDYDARTVEATKDFHLLKLVKEGDFVISLRSFEGGIEYAYHQGIISPAYTVLTPRNQEEARYYKYFLKSPQFIQSLKLFVTGIREGQNIDYAKLSRSFLPCPPAHECIRIANFLDQKTAEVDEAIAKKQRLIKRLKEQKAILINQAVTKGLNPAAPMHDSGVEWIGKVPAHWEVKKNRELFVERKESGSELLPILTVSLHTGVSDTEQDETENIRSKVRIEDKTSYRRVYPGDIAFNMMRAWQGAIGVVKADGQVSPAYIIATPCKQIDGEYFEYQYRTASFIGQMDRFSKGITDFRKRLYWAEFKTLNTIVPPVDEQLEIVKEITEIASCTDKTVEIIAQEIERIKEFRAVIIAEAVTGKIRI